MGGWVSIFSGQVFVGFGPNVECGHCHNTGWQEVWQAYTQHWAYSVIPTPKLYGGFTVRCRICYWGFAVGKKDKPRMLEILAAGKKATMHSFQKMSERDRQRLLRHLNRNGFTEISRVLVFSDPVVS